MIFGDISSFINQPSLTGIQRVVAEVFLRIVREKELDIAILHYDQRKRYFDILTDEQVYQCLHDGEKDLIFFNCSKATVDDFKEGDVFFDLDSVWDTVTPKRTELYPELKSRGVKIISYVYDITPVLAPKLTDLGVVHYFGYFIAATVKYADAIMSETESGINEVNELKKTLGLPVVPGYSTWLGSDFASHDLTGFKPDMELEKATRNKFVLMVGTLQPLKNHKVVLDAFDKALFKRGLSLVIAGKIGWDVDDFVKRVNGHPLLGKQLFMLNKLDDASINYLYKKAFCLAFSTIREGFGLPTVEALQHGLPVLESDIPVLREVGGDFCRYFDPYSPDSFVKAVTPLLESESEYREFRKKAASYRPVTWDDVARKVTDILRIYHPKRDSKVFNGKSGEVINYKEYEIGKEIGFSSAFAGLSFDIIENLWTCSREVRIPLKVSGSMEDSFLALHCSPFGAPFVKEQPCTMLLNNRMIGRISVGGEIKQIFRIPRQAFGRDGYNILTLLLPGAISPRALKISNDRRLLGLLLKSLRIVSGAEYFKCKRESPYHFGSDNNATARPFFLYGLSHIEREFTWTDGRTAKMLINPNGCGRAKFKFRYESYRQPERLVVYANGRRVAIRRLGRRGFFNFTVPEKVRKESGLISVTFVLPDAKSPKESGESTDSRKLGIRLYSFTVS